MAPSASSLKVRAVGLLCLFATGSEAALLHGLQMRLSSGGNAQIGLQLPQAADMDFGVAGPKPLLAVEVTPDAQQAAVASVEAGAAQLVIGTDAQGKWTVHSGEGDTNWVPVAWASYNNTVKQNGWSYLSLRTAEDPSVSKDVKMYAAGFLEGFVTAAQIRDFSHNAGILLKMEEDQHHALDNIQSMFGRSLRNICNKSGMEAGMVLRDADGVDGVAGDPWWQQARFAMVQAWGTMDGYNQRAKEVKGRAMSLVDLMVLNSDGETPELEQAYDMEEYLLRQSQSQGEGDAFIQQREKHRMGQVLHGRAGKPHVRQAERFAARRKHTMQDLGDAAWRTIKETSGRCSALVRLSKDNSDLMVGHTTFSDYSEMTRIFKYYDFPLGPNSVRKMGFSSYPGVAGSTDDYYLLDSGLVITETTVSMLTDEPYDKLQDNLTQVPDFMRIMVANRLARSGSDWAQLMTQSATGTYSSQWMVVDYNKFTPGKQLQDGTLTVIEQVPGLSHTKDMSSHLQEQGFWASENRAWFKDVRDSMGATEAEDMHGNLFSAEKNPRANIFKATAPNIQSLAEMRAEMRRNRWPHEVDGGEGNTPDHAISARGDLDSEHPSANGGVDAKVTNSCLVKKLQCHAVSGPTTDTQQPFRWTDAKTGEDVFPGMPHAGLPDVWNFGWVHMTPSGEAAVGAGDDTCA